MTTNGDIIELLRDVSGKLDGVVDRVGRLETAVAVDVAVSAQTRDKIDARVAAVELMIAEDMKPQTDDLKRMKLIGIGFLTLVGIGGLTIGGMLVWMGDAAINAVRTWLRIP